MSAERRKKFSLGDIIRKMNEEGGLAQAGGDEQPPTGAVGAAQSAEAAVPSQPADLPSQPRYGEGASAPAVLDNPPESRPSVPMRVPAIELGAAAVVSEPVTLTQYLPAVAQGPAEEEEEEQFDLFRYLDVVMRRRVPILIVVILAGCYSMVSYLRSEKLYTARARLLFQPGQQEIISDNQRAYRYWIDREKVFNTHLELLRSRAVLERVVDNLNEDIPVGRIQAGLTLKQGESDGQKNDIIDLFFKYPQPDLARDIINTVCNTYINYRREVSAQECTRLVFQLQTQIEKVQGELTEKENALRSFKEQNGMVQLSTETNLTVSKLSNMELALQQSELDLVEAKERLTKLRDQIGQQEANVVQSISYDNTFQNRLADLELQLSTLLAEYSPEHFKVKMLRQQIDTLKKAMETDVSNRAARQTTFVKNPIRQTLLQELVQLTIEKSALETKRTAQQQMAEKLNGELLRLPNLEQRYAYLQREARSLEQTLTMLKDKFEQAKIQRDSQESDLKVLELADTPAAAVRTVNLRNVIVGLLVGLLLGLALAFLLEYLDQTIKGPADVEKLLEIPLLGFVPLIQTERALVEDSKHLAKSVIEPFRAVRANLKHVIAQHNLRSIIICSAVKGEGKTTLAANLAITFSLDGKKVVLVDCDLRRPQIHKLFGLDKEQGASDYLTGGCGASAILKPTKYKNLQVITCGEMPHNPAELVGTVRFDHLVSELKDLADIVFFDSPALLPVSDVITMAPKMDGIIMVIRTLWTPVKAARQAKMQLKRIGCRIVGGILNGVSHSRGYYPYYYGYYGYYSYKYSYDYDRPARRRTVREVGIDVENRLRSVLRSARVLAPHYMALAASFVRFAARRKVFWLLGALFVAVLAANLWLGQFAGPGGRKAIEYLESSVTDSPPATRQAEGARPGQAASLEEIGNQVPGAGMLARDSASPVSPVPGGELAREGGNPISSLGDSAQAWADAFNRRDLGRYLLFYDSTKFVYPGGGFADWRQDLSRAMLSARHRNGIIRVEQTRVDSVNARYAKTTVSSIVEADRDTVRTEYVMVWESGSNRMWRIVRQKSTAIQ